MSVDSGDSKQREVALGGLPLACRAARERMRAFVARPEMRVFFAPISKGAVLALGLACVAMLGKESESRERGLSAGPETFGSVTIPVEGSAPIASVAQVAMPPLATPPCAPSNSPADEGTADAIVDINTAGEKEFRTLPGVGPKKAAAILALRDKLGRFRKVTDLLRVKGIGPKTLAKWRARLSVGEPPTTKT